MNSNPSSRDGHLDGDAIQALLDEDAGRVGDAVASARAHLEACAGCRARVDAWREVLGQLDELRRFAPPGRFAERVMSGIEVPKKVASAPGAWSWLRLRRWLTGSGATAHLSGRRLQDLADGVLSRRRSLSARAHLAACARCENRFEGWRRLMAKLETLPSLAPSAGFVERVMARRRAMAGETAGRSQPARGRASWLRSPRGWVLAGTLVSAPLAAFAGVAAFVSTFPQLTATGLMTYLWWQARDALMAFGDSLLAGVMQSGAAFRAYVFADYLIAAPAAALAGAAGFTLLTLTSVWILHRNLGFPRIAPRHAQT